MPIIGLRRERRAAGRAPGQSSVASPDAGRRVKTPTVLQMEGVECGAASLAMVLGYFRRYVPLEELRVACGVSRDGSKASNVLKAARAYGLETKAMRAEPAHLAGAPMPMILFWEFNHFLVLEGFGRKRRKQVAYLNDPGHGRRTVSWAEFDESFTGVALRMKPGPGFERGGRRPGVLAGLPSRLRSSWPMLVLSVFASLLLTVVGIAVPAFTRAFVDTVLVGKDASIKPTFFALMAAAVVATTVLTALRQSFLLRVRIISATVNSARFLCHLLRLPVGFYTQRSPADITSRMQSNDPVATTLANDLSNVVINVVVIVVYALLLWTYSPALTLLCVGISLLNILAVRLATRARATGVTQLAAARAEFLTTTYNGLQLIEMMKASGAENEYFRRWASDHAMMVNGRQRTGQPTALLAVVAPVLASFNNTLILFIGGLQAVSGHLSIGLLIAFQALVTAFTSPLTQLTGVAGRLQDFGTQVERLRDVENYPGEEPGTEPPDRLAPLVGRLTFENVTFGYSPLAPPLLENMTFTVGPGEQIALVGGSGSGKSTVTRLIAGLQRPWQGSVRIDGTPRHEIPRLVFGASVAFVDQDIFLFEGTVRDNLTLWDASVSDEDVIQALRDAGVYDVISSRPGGIFSRLEEDGNNFSGGQRQRLEIARALVRNPSLLVLDEATSALDSQTESVILDNLKRRGCAIVVVAHRLSTIRDSDQIVVMERGRVIEQGDHVELAAAAGRYAQLIGES
ncbi:NHLP family bacteriocin export ABC transporter peptidase/permease/ATPase subunit [Streptomyces sp. NPDC001833]|uniref:NHLP family bacteriocin export ABC transporter peptidase/permease/ATPase subunit n=1 Tax=Streptomyces sp. NPDC001833 TaxID=3154658 RepID=UPI00331D172F